MLRKKGISKVITSGLIGGMLSVAAFAADAPATKWYDTLSLSGYLQTSYVGNLNAPINRQNQLRAFDIDSNSFNLNAFHLQFAKPMGDDNYAFTTKLHTGRDAFLIRSKDFPGGNTLSATNFDVEEAYLTVATPGLKALTFTAGKFVTLEGVEVIESPLNPNFSEGYLFNFYEPYTHTGLKTNYAFTDKLNATVGLVNGWDQISDINDGKSVIWQVAATPTKMVSWSIEGTYGPEALADNQSKRVSLDSVLGLTVTDKLSLWGQANWGQDSNIVRNGGGGATDVVNYGAGLGNSKARWSGLGLWAQYVVCPTLTEALRFEVANDQGGGSRFGSGVNQTAKEFTWTNKFQLAKNVFTRLEYRHDWSNQGIFLLHDLGRTSKTQNTISADWVVTF